MSRRERGEVLVRRCLGLLRAHPRLLAFPALAVASATVALGAAFVAFFGNTATIARLYVRLGGPVGAARTVLAYLAFLLFFAVGAVVVVWWNAALAYCTRQAVRGAPVSVRAGLRAALLATPVLLVHGVAVAAFGTLVAFAERNFDLAARLVAWLLGAAYATLSVFVVPVAVFEGESVRGAYSRSARLVARRFGDVTTVTFGVFRVVGFVFAIPFALSQVLLIAAMVTRNEALLGLVGLLLGEHILLVGGPIVYLLGVGVVVGSAFATVTKVALYVEIVDDEPVSLVSNVEFVDAGDDHGRASTADP